MASLALETLDNPPQPPGDGGTATLPTPLQQGAPLPLAGRGSQTAAGAGSDSQDFLRPRPPPPISNQAPPPHRPPHVAYGLSGSAAASSAPRSVQTLPGCFPDIYDGDMQRWEEHFHSIQRAYKEFGKEDDFAIRVLTEDFTLPFPFAWPSESEAGRPPAYDPSDCAGFDFFLHPGQPVPRLLQPLHATTQAFFKKRRLEQLALSYASKVSLASAAERPLPQDAGPALRPDIVFITTVPCVATTAAPGEPPPFLLQESKAPRNIQPAPTAIPTVGPQQSINLQFMSPTRHGPF